MTLTPPFHKELLELYFETCGQLRIGFCDLEQQFPQHIYAVASLVSPGPSLATVE